MRRRSFIALAGAVAFAGCLGDNNNQLFAEDVEAGEGALYPAFEVSAGDELEVTIEAEDDGANTGISATQFDGIDEGVNWWGWEPDPGERLTDTIEIVEDGKYTVWINEGSASVTIERN